jgi:hypothetical protein
MPGPAQRAERHRGRSPSRTSSGVEPTAIRKALAGFGGVKRRFTKDRRWNRVAIFDDYGHHPIEIAGRPERRRAPRPTAR